MGRSTFPQRAAHFGSLVALMGFTGCVGVGCPTRGPIQYMADTRMTHQVERAVKTIQPGVTVKSFDSVVSLSGVVNSPEQKQRVVAIAQRVTGVRVVLDYTKVRQPAAEPRT